MASSFPMVGGDGPHSYANNSTFQRNAAESAKALIKTSITEKLDVKKLISSSPSNSFTLADLGCSVGPNTFLAVQNIIDSVKSTCQSHGLDSEAIEFQVFFNDHSSNDFNTLFNSLPLVARQYFAAGVPGSFHGRLFPRASLHFVFSSYSLQWLSRVPKELVDKQSPAWNKGRIYYNGGPSEVLEAYSAQFAKDMESFLSARAEELVPGGLMALIVPCYPVGTPPAQYTLFAVVELIESILNDMVKMGLLDEDKVDSFNLPRYNPTPQEIQAAIEKNGCFSVEKMEPLVRLKLEGVSIGRQLLHLRASWEGLIKQHFGTEINDKLFDIFSRKGLELSIYSQSKSYKSFDDMFILLKAKAT